MKYSRKTFGTEYSSRLKRAKRRHMEVMNATSRKQRLAPYKDLLKITRETIDCAEKAVVRLRAEKRREAHRLAKELDNYIEIAWKVVSQTERGVLSGNRFRPPRI